ncbi:hypothetical protein FBULB1_104 [Fusarium bulbicola]|nr:hypothetical protein FBULB1_104 [Fusarium bulbicola]
MEEHHVYHHHHHHHYHYHYNYPFPPGLAPNAPQNDEPLNQEVADGENDEPPAENEEDEEENEHSERGDTEDQRHPENRSPSPVQQEERLANIETSRVGLAVFDDYFSLFNLDAQSAKAQARWTNTQPNNGDHREGPPRKKARTSTHSGQPISRGDSSNTSTQPLQSGNTTVINKALVISADEAFRVLIINSLCETVPPVQ